jgi:integrase
VTNAGKALESHFGDSRDITSVTTEQLVGFASARKQVVTAATVRRDLMVYAQACAAVGVTAAKLPDIGDTSSKPQEPFTLDEVRRFMLACSRRTMLLGYALHFCGLRNSEVKKLDAPDWENKRVWCKGTKTKDSKRWIFPPDEMWEFMATLRAAGEWRGWPKLSKAGVHIFVVRTSKRAGLGHRHPNDCRGGFATRLAIAGVPAAMRGALMGNSEKTQAIYSQPNTDQRALAEAMQQHPRIRPWVKCAASNAGATTNMALLGTVTPLKTLGNQAKGPA